MDIEAVIAALGGRYDADEAAVIKRVLREYGGTVPDQQLIEEIGLALAIRSRARRLTLTSRMRGTGLDQRRRAAKPRGALHSQPCRTFSFASRSVLSEPFRYILRCTVTH